MSGISNNHIPSMSFPENGSVTVAKSLNGNVATATVNVKVDGALTPKTSMIDKGMFHNPSHGPFASLTAHFTRLPPSKIAAMKTLAVTQAEFEGTAMGECTGFSADEGKNLLQLNFSASKHPVEMDMRSEFLDSGKSIKDIASNHLKKVKLPEAALRGFMNITPKEDSILADAGNDDEMEAPIQELAHKSQVRSESPQTNDYNLIDLKVNSPVINLSGIAKVALVATTSFLGIAMAAIGIYSSLND